MDNIFTVGQRWLSQAEPDLGLGVVAGVEGRQVKVDYPAAGASRRYAVAGAPLLRLRFEAGDEIEDQAGQTWKVESVDEVEGRLTYRCVDPSTAQAVELPESELDSRLQINRPYDRLLARRIDAAAWFSLRLQAWQQNAWLWASPVFGFSGPRIEWLPHQLYIAAEVASRASPRVLLADEVGLGKTIEAGLILHRLLLTERVKRVLLIVPESLLHQWLVEMLRRFNLTFSVFDHSRLEAASEHANPFDEAQRVLCSQEFLVEHEAAGDLARRADWDLLLVDEAHHLAWSEEAPSAAYRLVEQLAERADSVLLLTATPEQLGRAGHFGRLRLLDPRRFHDYAAFVAEEDDYAAVAEIAARLIDGESLLETQQRTLEALLGDEAQGSADEIVQRLIDRHGTGRVLFRNTRHAISGFPQRVLTSYPLASPQAYETLAAEVTPEWAYGPGWAGIDPRVDWLIELCRSLAPEKLLVICSAATTATELRDHLVEKAALKSTAFHEGMDIVARDRAAAFFADPEAGAQVLVCSEMGSEGRNFQFAHHLVMFDLPRDPDLLEQRIGRLDRIGQRETIQLHVPFLEASAGEVLMHWYRDGLGSFEAICPAASAVYAALSERLERVIAGREALDPLLQDARQMTQRLNADLEQGRDRLLELHSNRPGEAQALCHRLASETVDQRLRPFIEDYWDAFGVEHESGPGQSVVLRAGAHMLGEHFPGLLADGMTVTFDRADALVHEDRHFLTWEHPMARGAIDMLTSGGLGGASVVVCQHPDFRTGMVLLEALFVVDCVAPAELALRRFLPPTVLRLVLDAHGEELSDALPHDELRGVCLAKNRKLLDTVVNSQKARMTELLQRAEELAAKRADGLVWQARRRVEEELDAELRRLKALARVSHNVRESEIHTLERHRGAMLRHLDEVRVRFDALRLVVMR